MKLGIAEILAKASGLPTRKERSDFLREHDSVPLRIIIKMAYDRNLKWALPDGPPPYKPSELTDNEGMLYQEVESLKYVIESPFTVKSPVKREQLFVQLLETINADDAKLLLAVKEKTLPYKGLTPSVIEEAFPGLI